jgi:hypothetical protein
VVGGGSAKPVHAPQPTVLPTVPLPTVTTPLPLAAGGGSRGGGRGAGGSAGRPAAALGPARPGRRGLDPVAVVVAILALLAVGGEVIALDIGRQRRD